MISNHWQIQFVFRIRPPRPSERRSQHRLPNSPTRTRLITVLPCGFHRPHVNWLDAVTSSGPLRFTTLPARTSFLTDGAVDIVIVRSCFSHRLQAPIGCCCSCQIEKLVVEFTEGTIRGLTAERGATNLYKLSRHLVLLNRRSLGYAASVPPQAVPSDRLQSQRAVSCSRSAKVVLRTASRPSRRRVLWLHR
jgi:hypothetical protein